MNSRTSSSTPPLALQLIAALLFSALSGCGGAQISAPLPEMKIEDGERISLAGTRATMTLPRDMKRKHDDPKTYLLIVDGTPWLMLTITIQPTPTGDIDSFIDQHVANIQRSGRTGVLRNDRVNLGDLEARLISAEDLLGQRRAGLLQVVAPAEDGIYVATFYGVSQIIHDHKKALIRSLLSLRVPTLKGGIGERRPKDPSEDPSKDPSKGPSDDKAQAAAELP